MKLSQEKFAIYLKELETLHGITDFHEYEKKFSEFHKKFGKETLELKISEQTIETNKPVSKKNSNQVWRSCYCQYPCF